MARAVRRIAFRWLIILGPAAAVPIAACSSVKEAPPSLDDRLESTRMDLLTKYASFKNYRDRDPQHTYDALSPDRQAVFDAIVRALFQPLYDEDGYETQDRLIAHLEAIHGIWGVRPGMTEGKKQFRVSVRWKNSLPDAVAGASNFNWSLGAHVLKPGGDDDPQTTLFEIVDDDVATYRQLSAAPTLQVNYLRNERNVGEVDLDFDTPPLICGCHCFPSNSDAGSSEGRHSHLKMFNRSFRFFRTSLSPRWSDDRHHCQGSY